MILWSAEIRSPSERWEGALRPQPNRPPERCPGEGPQTPPAGAEFFLQGPQRGSSLRIWKIAPFYSLIMSLGTARAGAFCKMFSV